MVDEFAWIERLRSRVVPRDGLRLGIGDDAAIADGTGARQLVLTTDLLSDGVHFDSRIHPAEQVGHKSLAVNLSDIAAMVARPEYALLSLAIPTGLPDGYLDGLVDGLLATADAFGVQLAGGDTTSTPGPLVINVALVGTVERGAFVTRDAARGGDLICVTGALGGSYPTGEHLTFRPRVAEATSLASALPLTSLTDVSDGLAVDLQALCEPAGVGAVLFAEQIPCRLTEGTDDRSPIEHALYDGEDFELLFTIPSESRLTLESITLPDCPVTCIGEIVAQPGLLLRTDRGDEPIAGWGYEHKW